MPTPSKTSHSAVADWCSEQSPHRTFREQRRADYQKLVTNIVDIARGLGDAILAHHEFINQQRLDGVAYSVFKPINLNALESFAGSGCTGRRRWSASRVTLWCSTAPTAPRLMRHFARAGVILPQRTNTHDMI